MHLNIRRRLFLSHFFAVLLVSGSTGGYFYFIAARSLMETIQSRLENSAALIGQTLDATELESIRDASDRTSPIYDRTLDLLRSLGRTNPDIAFVYVMRHSGGRVYFVLDSDESEQQALPGREYMERMPSLMLGFQRPSADDRVYEDEWGSFMSGYAPLRNGNGEYLVGLDMRAEELQQKLEAVRIAATLSLLFAIVLAVLFSRLLSSHFTKPVRILIERCRTIARGELAPSVEMYGGGELDQLVEAFNAMSRQLADSRERAERAQQSLQQARDLLELRVAERTQDLMDVNERLLHEVAERARAEELLAQAARSDPLTGLMNRRAMLEHLEYQAARFQRNQVPFSLLLGDLDHFKSINDTFGHDAGDQALIQTTHFLVHGIRTQDLVARWGGEEFLILLPDTDLEGALVVAEALRKGVAAKAVVIGDKRLHLTLSIGVASYGLHQSISQCIKAADRALYEGKLQGRNRVVAAKTQSPPGSIRRDVSQTKSRAGGGNQQASAEAVGTAKGARLPKKPSPGPRPAPVGAETRSG
ncbi:MAG: diguanylate cyclase [Chromatiaceae bacterium]